MISFLCDVALFALCRHHILSSSKSRMIISIILLKTSIVLHFLGLSIENRCENFPIASHRRSRKIFALISHTALRKHASRHESFVRIDCHVEDASTWLCIIPCTRQHAQELKSVYQIIYSSRYIYNCICFFFKFSNLFPLSCATK